MNYSLFYVLKGPGVTLPPIGLFSVIPNTGMLKVHNTIDREQYNRFNVSNPYFSSVLFLTQNWVRFK